MLMVIDTNKIKAKAFDAILETYEDHPHNQKLVRERVEEIADEYNSLRIILNECRVPVNQTHKE